MTGCPFCERIADQVEIVDSIDTAVAFRDVFPVAAGHLLVVPIKHVNRVEELDPNEWTDLFELVRKVSRDIAKEDGVDGVNVGFNSGPAAGQTVEHAHVHVIPRELGDVPDPRGGVRRVVPDRADYWSDRKPR